VIPSVLNTKERNTLAVEGWCEDGNVRVTEHWRIIERKKMLVMFQDGSVHTIYSDSEYSNEDLHND
jgi:hypothetical protein